MGWGIMVLTTYPYVFLLSTESFSISDVVNSKPIPGVGP